VCRASKATTIRKGLILQRMVNPENLLFFHIFIVFNIMHSTDPRCSRFEKMPETVSPWLGTGALAFEYRLISIYDGAAGMIDAAGTEEPVSVGRGKGGSAGADLAESIAAGSAGRTIGGKASTSSSGSGGIEDDEAVDGIGE
jgi:hypothetical protein